MRIGVVFPQTELGGDAGAVRAYALRAEELGFTHLLAYDHVVGADPAVHPGWDRPYDVHTTFHEPMVLYGYLAAVTSMELVTGIIILPQRQTVLVAKQAAEVDLLTGGKFRLGVGIGWNHVEYEALGQDFSTRGQRLEEQIPLLRRLWTEQTVTFSGTFDQITGAGLAPLPVQRPIPVWFGAQSPRAYRRAGRLADGWFPQMAPGPRLEEARGIVLAARSMGASHFRILRRHVLPNILQPILIQATVGMAGAILAEATLSFLGLGVLAPLPSWGAMLNDARNHLFDAPHMVIFPALGVVLAVLAFNLLGDAWRDWLDPRTRAKMVAMEGSRLSSL